ncbi:hypothetical protein JG687_00005153, partial [Phytophthora cactorum]
CFIRLQVEEALLSLGSYSSPQFLRGSQLLRTSLLSFFKSIASPVATVPKYRYIFFNTPK